MIEKLPTKKFWELYKKLPPELQDTLFSDEVGENIVEICARHEVSETLDFIIDGVSDVFLGVLPPNEFLDNLKKELKTEPAMTRRIIHEINRFIFFPVKGSLENIYDLQMTPIAGAVNPAQKNIQKSAYQEPIG